MRKIFCIIAMSGCVSACASAPPVPAVEIKGDSYCEIAKKIAWSQADTPQTVRQVVRENAKIDRVCGVNTS